MNPRRSFTMTISNLFNPWRRAINTMAEEVEKLRAELNNTPGADKRAGSAYNGAVGYGVNNASSHHSLGKNPYEDGYPGPQLSNRSQFFKTKLFPRNFRM